MKKFIALALTVLCCLSFMTVYSSAANLTRNFSIDMDFNQTGVYFADVIYDGELVGFGYFHYDSGKGLGSLVLEKTRIETEYQNHELSRNYGSYNPVDITVYAYLEYGNKSDQDEYSWSDDGNKGGNNQGWITAEAIIDAKKASRITGYVKVKSASEENTYNYVGTDK